MASQDSKMNNNYVNELQKEQQGLNNKNSHAFKLLQKEIQRVRSGEDGQRADEHISIHNGQAVRVKCKIHIPIEENPGFNYVGKLLGPKGSSLQQLQEATHTRMAILGKGSMRDKKKEEEFRTGGDPKYSHLTDELHLEISTLAPAPEAYRRLAHACADVQRFMVPDQAPFNNNQQEYYNGPQGGPPQQKYPGEGGGPPPHMAPRPGPPGPRPPMGPPHGMQSREPPRRPAMVQSTYATPDHQDEWQAPAVQRPARGRGGFNAGQQPARAPPSRGYEEPAQDYNNFNDGYNDGYNSGTSAPYYDAPYQNEPEPAYNDGYSGESRHPPHNNSHGGPGPMRGSGGGGGGGSRGGGAGRNGRPQPYGGGAQRQRY